MKREGRYQAMGEGAYLSNAQNKAADAAARLWAATDPVDPLRDYSIPIQPFRHPPAKEDFQQLRRRRKQKENEPEQEPEQQPEVPHSDSNKDGHIDDYA